MDDLLLDIDWNKINSRGKKLDKKRSLVKKHSYNVKAQFAKGYRFKKETKRELWKINLEK